MNLPPMVTLEVRIGEMQHGINALLDARELDLKARISEVLSTHLTEDKLQALIWKTTTETTDKMITQITEQAVRNFFYNDGGAVVEAAVKAKLRTEMAKILQEPEA